MKTSFIHRYLKLSGYTIEDKTFLLQLMTHPEYQSLKAVSDTFDYFGIENLVAKVPKESLQQLPVYFIALMEIHGKEELFLVKNEKDKIVTTNDSLKKEKWDLVTFTENWQGTIIAIEANSNDVIVSNLFKKEYLLSCLLAFLAIVLFFQTKSEPLIYSFLCLLGVIVSYFIVRQSIGINNKTIEKVCQLVSKKQGCKSVINDENSKQFGVISLSDASLAYFSSLVLTLLLVGYDLNLFLLLSLAGIPIVLYSFYYQGFILKKWCALCLGISSILIMQLIFLVSNFQSLVFDFVLASKFVFILFSVFAVWDLTRKIITKNLTLENIEIDFLKFKRNKTLFKILLKKEKLINDNLIHELDNIQFGSKNPKVIIQAITNPLCGFCVESFMVYHQFMQQYNEIQVQFIFANFTDQKEHPSNKITETVVAIYKEHGEEKALKALFEWFAERDFDKWSLKFGIENPKFDYTDLIKKHQIFIAVNNINYTPATILNGYFFPKEYNIKDLSLFIDDMILESQKPEMELV